MSSITHNKYKFTSRAIEYFIWGKHHDLPTSWLDLLTAGDCPFLSTLTPRTPVSGRPAPLSTQFPWHTAWTGCLLLTRERTPPRCKRGTWGGCLWPSPRWPLHRPLGYAARGGGHLGVRSSSLLALASCGLGPGFFLRCAPPHLAARVQAQVSPGRASPCTDCPPLGAFPVGAASRQCWAGGSVQRQCPGRLVPAC